MNISRRKLLLGVGAAGVLAGGAALVPMVRRDGKFVEAKSRASFVEGTQGALPKEADVVIIGAGIQGIMTAINLAERGMSVTILEKGQIAGEQAVHTAKLLVTKHHQKSSHYTIMGKYYGVA